MSKSYKQQLEEALETLSATEKVNRYLVDRVSVLSAGLQRYADSENWSTMIDRRFGAPKTNHAFKGVSDNDLPYGLAKEALDGNRLIDIFTELAQLRQEKEKYLSEWDVVENDIDGENQPIST